MKRGKDDEKIMGPMFPRLHVNDTEKGGPRAPPRNKMALYEQLSIPSQRFNQGVVPLNHPNNTSSLVLPASSGQGNGLERNFHLPLHGPPPVTKHQGERLLACQSEGPSLNNSLAQFEQRKKVGEEDDSIVPVFVQSGTGQCLSKTQNSMDREKFPPLKPSYSGHSIKHQNVCDKDPRLVTSLGLNLRQQGRCKNEVHPKVSGPIDSVEHTTHLSSRENIEGLVKESYATPRHEYQDRPATNTHSLLDIDACLQQEFRTRSQEVDTGFVQSVGDVDKISVPHPRSNPYSREDNCSPNEPDKGSECRGDMTNVALEMGNADRSDDISETSMVASISGFDISPDDVVGIIGQKHFWKARRAIVNQQRVFAVQVFELHRLIKVQQLIAGSPHLLLEDGAFLGKRSLKDSPVRKLPAKYVVRLQSDISNCKDDSEKPNHKMEHSAENAEGKSSLSSVKNGSQPSNYGFNLGNSQPARVAADNKMGPWCYHQSPAHQWLIPVVSPSEGLVYKPYPGPGFTGTVCGGCGPFSPAPLAGNFMNSAYGVPAHPHHQGIGNLPPTPVGHTYFPTYGMPVMSPAMSGSAIERVDQFAGPGSHGQTELSGAGANFNLRHQSPSNVPNQINGAVSQVGTYQAFKDGELQGSTASSPAMRPKGVRTVFTSEERDALPLFPMDPVVPEAALQPYESDRTTRVIKVVPHNPQSATESAARIFQSIQDERKQYDSI